MRTMQAIYAYGTVPYMCMRLSSIAWYGLVYVHALSKAVPSTPMKQSHPHAYGTVPYAHGNFKFVQLHTHAGSCMQLITLNS